MQTWVSVAVSLLAIYLATNEGRWQLARKRGEETWFNTGLFTRFVYFVGMLVCVAGVALPSSEWVVAANDWLTTAVFVLLICLAVLTWPKTIVVDVNGVTELSWGGLRRRKVDWNDVMHAVRIETDEELEVHLIPRHGKPIKHTKLHVDRTRFIREVGKHVEVFGGPPKVL